MVRWILGAAAALTVLSAAVAHTAAGGQTATSWRGQLGSHAVYWFIWAAFAPAVVRLTRRFPFADGVWKRSLPAHVAAAVTMGLTHIVLTNAYDRAGGSFDAYVTQVKRVVWRDLDWQFIIYSGIVVATLAVLYHRESQRKLLEAARLEADLAQSELRNLQAQLHPRLFFNTLHTISAAMQHDVNSADRMLTRLGDLVRLSLDRIGKPEVALKDEREFVEKYAEIEYTRLSVRFDIEPEALDALVPALILQPLVDSAAGEDAAPRVTPALVVVDARRDAGRLRIEVRGEGRQLTPEELAILQQRVGVWSIRERLRQHYGAGHDFEFCRNAPGLCARVVIPYRVAPDPPEQNGVSSLPPA